MSKTFEAWCADNEIDAATLNDAYRKALTAAWKAEDGKKDDPVPSPSDRLKGDIEAARKKDQQTEELRQVIKAALDNRRISTDTAEYIALKAAAEEWNRDKVDLEIIRAERPQVGVIQPSDHGNNSAAVIEAAVCRRAGLENIEKHFSAQVLEASEQRYKRGLSLVGLLDESAKRNGWRNRPDVESKDFLRAAFGQRGDGGLVDIRAGTTGPSTYSLPNIVGNIANKFLKSGFLSVDSTWSGITYKRAVNDFKATTTARLNGALIYRTLAPGGEIKHGTLTESTFTNQASTYAIMIGIDRRDLINDDIGAFTELSKHMGRGAGLKINDLFWTVFLNNSSFFTSGNANVSTGAGSALGTADGAAINAAEVKFINQTDPNGYPVALMPKILLAPPTLANTARRWMGSFGMVQSGTAGLGDSNIFNGRYSVATSPYMENSSYTGNSTAAWYLLADPNDEAVIEGVALNNRWEPTVDTAEPDFNQLGMAMRGYIDVGFAFKEPRAGVRSAGS